MYYVTISFLTKDDSISKIGSHAKKWARRYLSILSKSGSLHLGTRLNASERPIFFHLLFFPPLLDTTCVWSRHVRDFLRWDFNEHVGYFSESFTASRFNTFRSASFVHRTCSRTLKHIPLFNPPQPHPPACQDFHTTKITRCIHWSAVVALARIYNEHVAECHWQIICRLRATFC